MLSTLRVLRGRSVLSAELLMKSSSAGLHVCVKPFDQKENNFLKWKKNLKFTALPLSSVKFLSTGSSPDLPPSSSTPQTFQEPIPEPPTPIEESVNLQIAMDPISSVEEIASMEEIPPPPETSDVVGGEPSFESLGLGGWSPPGLVQQAMEFLHISLDVPWWGTIVIGTIVVRTLLFPLVILAQRNAAKMNNHLPGMQEIQLKMSEARERGDRLDAARYAQEMMTFMREKELNPFKNMLVPLAQAPLFISFFMGLRAMANLPVESLKTGGLFWFVDLTLPDQFYLLPIITSLTLLVTIEVGTDAAKMNAANMGMMKYVLRALPIVIFPFTVNFPAAILVYWTSTNFISLLQVSVLKIPRVRKYFNIDPLITHDKKKLPIKDKGFVKGVKDSWTNLKITRELEDRQRIDEMNFMQAGRGAVKKTFKYDPTKRPPRSISPAVIEAKKRE